MSAELRALIRDVLQEELASLKGNSKDVKTHVRREEVVNLQTDADLARFVDRILKLAHDTRARAAIESRDHVFRLARSQVPPIQAFEPSMAAQNAPPLPTHINEGLVTEKTVASLPEGQRSISIGKQVRFTPLARDELRRRKIRIERLKR